VEIMADKDLLFYKALGLFHRIAIYANAINDQTVPYVTAAFEPYDPFATFNEKKLDLEFEQGYEPLLKKFSTNDKTNEDKISKESRPKQSFSAWLKSLQPAPIPGPFREWKFPMNIVFMAFLPVLIPIFLLIVATRFTLSSRSSHARVKLLESDKEGMARRLIAAWAKLEKDVEDAVEDIVEESILPAMSGGTNGSATDSGGETGSTLTLTGNLGSTVGAIYLPISLDVAKSQPLLRPAQHRMIANLNSLPNLTKHVAFINPVRNSHSIIICRNVATMTEHKKGEGVIRAWADGMKL